MAEIEDRLAPRDGLNNYNVLLARLDLPSHGGAQFTFAVTNSMLPVTELVVGVPNTGQGLDRMTVEAHGALIDVLRQLLFRAEKARLNHERNARPVVIRDGAAPAALQDDADLAGGRSGLDQGGFAVDDLVAADGG